MKLELQDYLDGFARHDRAILARAITLVESRHPAHVQLAQELLQKLLPQTGNARRLGISGTPGVGKSTFIESFGRMLTAGGKSVAVLAVDPTSQVSGGSILGDKTRMQELSNDPRAFIRPSPSGETLGGVARRTRESILLCEAFGFDYVLVETVGVGQSETTVSQMVDMFIMLLQPGAGDDLQGIKRGILELVDMVVVTKDDGDNQKVIEKARHDYAQALHILRTGDWVPAVLSCSALTKRGLPEIQTKIDQYFSAQKKKIQKKRTGQSVDWMWQLIEEGLLDEFKANLTQEALDAVSVKVQRNELTALQAAEKLLSEHRKARGSE
jgi:LAO/AO transport system kinase